MWQLSILLPAVAIALLPACVLGGPASPPLAHAADDIIKAHKQAEVSLSQSQKFAHAISPPDVQYNPYE